MSHVEIIKQNDLSVYLMEIDGFSSVDLLDSLTESEVVKYHSIHHPGKKSEFIASRHLRTLIFGKQQIMYTEIGSPYLDTDGFISISHTTNLVGIAHSKSFKVGLDLECVRAKAAQLSSRFVHEKEKLKFNISDPKEMSALWSMKETLYKLAGRKGIIFAEELWVEKADELYLGNILQPTGIQQFELIVRDFEDKLITCNTSDANLHSWNS